ncbi:RHS repeat-associated core domain-containing protein [Serratia sp. UGAL515B_01]|uniref:RHS repeat-associated core domain-containing protein n=1 Tax=Serratia sp. UGAL515B_01 TaxID=2986763 RepID=UPI0029548CEB|nr:RHS repeat-associated core domain-containing protein [Serratia sp. UGAL515B_01]WON75863.1 DUF6531 domain-containing protein [Serratia sp. UGAL515B_01]
MAEGNTIGTLVNQSSPNSSGGDTNPPVGREDLHVPYSNIMRIPPSTKPKLTRAEQDSLARDRQAEIQAQLSKIPTPEEVTDPIHTGLDLASLIPVAGSVADIFNGSLYYGEGRYGEATLSYLSALVDWFPGAAEITKGVKYGYKGIKAGIKTFVKEEKFVVKEEKFVAKAVRKTERNTKSKTSRTDEGFQVKDNKKGKPGNRKDCPRAGNPVNPVLGIKFMAGETELDFFLPAALPLFWQRSYYSDQIGNGWFGQGWSLPFSMRLLRKDNDIVLVNEQGRKIKLPHLDIGQNRFDRHEQFFFAREENGCYCVTTSDRQLQYLFSPLDLGEDDPQGNRAPYLPLIAIQDTNGNLIRLFYNDVGLPVIIQDAADRWLELRFITLQLSDGNKTHRLQSVVLLSDRVNPAEKNNKSQPETLVSYQYSAEGDLIGVYDERGQIRRNFSYFNHMLTEHSQPGGLVARYEYDVYTLKGKVVRHTTNLGQVWLFDYRDGETRVTDPLQRVTCYQYNADQTFTGFVDAQGHVTQAKLDNLNRPVTFITPGGQQTHYTYNQYGKVTTFTDTAGHRTTFCYNSQQQLTTITDVMGHTTYYEYHPENNSKSIINPQGQRTKYIYEHRGLATAIKSSQGLLRQMSYNSAGLLTSWTDCSGNTTHLTYDARACIATITSPDGTLADFTHNLQGKRLTSLFADGSKEYCTYDSLGRLIGRRDALGAQTAWQLDIDGLPLKRINASGESFHYQYDLARRLVKLINENGSEYRINYDENDNIICEKTFDNAVIRYRYNANGQLIEKKELGLPVPGKQEKGILTTLRYDALGRVVEKIIWNEALNSKVHNYFEYNAAGLLTRAQNAHSIIKRHYNTLGQLVSETCEVMGQSQTIQHEYDDNGQRSRTLLPDGTQLDYLYYGPGHLLQINVDGEIMCEIERDNMHREINRTQGKLTSHFRYSPTGQLISQHAVANIGDTDFISPSILRRYQYDKAGNLKIMSDMYGGETLYQYDLLGRLTKCGEESFAFDPTHNLIDSSAKFDNQKLENNHLIRYQNNHYIYDCFGNLSEKITDGGKYVYLYYNPEHQLERIEVIEDGNHNRTTEYGYDALGRRIYKKNQDNLFIFLWDNDHLVNESSADQTITYLYEKDSFIPLAQIVTHPKMAKKIYYYHNDQIGTPREMTTQDGQIIWRACYKAWGKMQQQELPWQKNPSVSLPQPLRFQGQYHDEESGLHYNRYRYYDPDIGRFITPDPLGLVGGENPYHYAPNPTVWVDPLGLMNEPGRSSGISSGNIGAASYAFDQRTKNMTVKTHGMPFATQTDKLASGSSLTKQVQDVVNKNGGHVNRVTLQSCYSAVGGPASQAQQLANKLGKPVTGYTGKYTDEIRGGATRALDGSGGNTKMFQPSSSDIGKTMSSALNKAGNSVSKGVYNASKIFKG